MAEENSSVTLVNVTLKESCEPTVERVIVSIIFFLLSFVGLITYILFIVIVIRYKSSHFKSSFYTMAVALAAADIPVLFIEVVFVVPFLFICDNDIKNWLNRLAGGIINVTYFSLSFQTLLISLNRFFAVCVYKHYDRVFTPTNVYLMMVFIAIYSITRTILLYSTGCRVLFDGYSFTYKWPPIVTLFQQIYFVFEPTLSYVVVALVAVMYGIIFVCVKIQGRKLTASGKATVRQKRERNLMIQFLFVVMVLVIYETLWFAVPALTEHQILSGNQGSIIINIFTILNSAVPPFMSILFAADMKAIILNRAKVGSHGLAMTERSVLVSRTPTNSKNHSEEEVM